MDKPHRSSTSFEAETIAWTAFLKVSLPSIRRKCRRSATDSAVAGQALPPPGSSSKLAFEPSDPRHVVRRPRAPGLCFKMAAPAPSPKSTQVLRSVQSTTELIFSAPMMSTVSCALASTNRAPISKA